MKADEDPDLQRASDLLNLHQGVKMKHIQGEDTALTQARREVDMVMEKLAENSIKQKRTGG